MDAWQGNPVIHSSAELFAIGVSQLPDENLLPLIRIERIVSSDSIALCPRNSPTLHYSGSSAIFFLIFRLCVLIAAISSEVWQ